MSGFGRKQRVAWLAVTGAGAGMAFMAFAATDSSAAPLSPIAGAQPVESGAHWRVVDALPSRGESLRALAFDEELGLAVADDAGVSWWREGSWSRAQLPPVRDLAFGAAGRLWIGTEAGLFFWARDARPQRRPLRDGEGSNWIARIESLDGALVVATESGAYWSTSGSVFQPLGSGSSGQAVTSVALRRVPAPGLTEVWSFGAEGLVRTRGLETGAGLRVVDRIVWPLPRPAAEAGAVDLVLDRDQARLHLVYPDAIAVQGLEDVAPTASRWRTIRPVLPAGALIRRFFLGASGRVWLVSDRGLLVASALDGPFARAGNPAGVRECVELLDAPSLPDAARALALCRTNLRAWVVAANPPGAPFEETSTAHATSPAPATVTASEAATKPATSTNTAILLPADPPVAEIRSRALVRIGLAVERAEGLWQGLRRRALWPSLELRGGFDADQDRGHSRDQSFISGDLRNLFDRDRGEGQKYGAAVVLDWELGGIAYPDDAVDLSRELRQVTSLRDDVSDEIHQLYFERQRIRARLARGPGVLAPDEAAELVLRAAELDSGLDAWTGGWISAWRTANEDAGADPIHPRRIDRSID